MRVLLACLLAALTLVALPAGPGRAAPAQAYAVTALGGSVAALNGQGQMAGEALTGELGPDGAPVTHAFLWDGVNDRRDLGVLPTGTRSTATALSDGGQVVGWSEVWVLYPGEEGPEPMALQHAFLWDAEHGMRDLGTLGGTRPGEDFNSSWATGVNNLGQVVGVSQVGNEAYHAFIWDAERGMRDLGPPPGSPADEYYSTASSINDAGQVLWTGGLWSPAGNRTLEELIGKNGGGNAAGYWPVEAGTHALNNSGQLLGQLWIGAKNEDDAEVNVPFTWSPEFGYRELLPRQAEWGAAVAVNNRGQVIGLGPDGPFLWDAESGPQSLAPRLPDGWTLDAVTDLTDRGEILGWASRQDGLSGTAVLLTPPDREAPVRTLALTIAWPEWSGNGNQSGTVTATVTLGTPAPAGGTEVRLTVQPAGVVAAPESLVIPEGKTDTAFSIQIPAPEKLPEGTWAVLVGASAGGITEYAVLGLWPFAEAGGNGGGMRGPDRVRIDAATYDKKRHRLTVRATSGRKGVKLRVFVAANKKLIGTLKRVSGKHYRGTFTLKSSPRRVVVRSTGGGSARRAVRGR